MKTYIKYFMIITLAALMVACGGGGGSGGNPGGVNTPPPGGGGGDNNTPAVESPVLNLTNNITSPESIVTAGQSFIITAQLAGGESATVNFANGLNTPDTIKYNPESCTLTHDNNECTSIVTVGLPTPAISFNPGYTTDVIAVANGVSTTSTITFGVTMPQLMVSLQPSESIFAGNTTTIGFSLSPSSVPAGSGSIEVLLGSYPFSDIISLPSYCTINYSDGAISSGGSCDSIQVSGELAGGPTVIEASAEYFTAATSDSIMVQAASEAPRIDLSTNLAAPAYSVFAGQKFVITAQSRNGATSKVNFANSINNSGAANSNIKYEPQSCIVQANKSCSTIVTVSLGVPAVNLNPGYTTDVTFSDGTDLAKRSITFGVNTPPLKFSTQVSPPGTLLTGKSINLAVSVESAAIPDGNGSIPVTLSLGNPNIVSFPNGLSCVINYANRTITTNSCSIIQIHGSDPGSTTVVAAAANFITTVSNSITVTPYLVYVANNGSTSISMYSINSAGILSALPTQVNNVYPPLAMTRDSSGRYLYVTSGKTANSSSLISMYSIDENTGALNHTSPATIATGNGPIAIAANPIKPYIYAIASADNKVIAYSMNSVTGVLQLVGSTYTGSSPSGIVVHPNGKFVYITNAASNNISEFTIDLNSGGLAAMYPFPTVATGINPTAITFEPKGAYAYVTTNGAIAMYNVDKNAGNLMALATPTLPTDGQGLAVVADPLGGFIYVINNLGFISTYAINLTSPGAYGQLTIKSKYLTGNNPSSLVLDPTGQYAYVTNAGSNTVSMFKVTPTIGISGSLTTPTVATGSSPTGIIFN